MAKNDAGAAVSQELEQETAAEMPIDDEKEYPQRRRILGQWCDRVDLKNAGAPFHLFYGGRTGTELPLVGELERRGIALTLSTDDGTRGETGRVTAPLLKALDREKGQSRLYACGPEAMMQAVAKIAAERDRPCEVSLDLWMGCGLGTSLGCVVKNQEADELRPRNRPACTEGPVFDAKRVVWPH